MPFNTKDKYIKVLRKPDELTDEHEIRVNSKGKAGNYIARAKLLFLGEKKFEYVILKAAGAAISTCCIAADIIRRRIKGLHQICKFTHSEIVDEYEPIEEGLINVKIVRQLSVLEIKLTKIAEGQNEYGYQKPLPDEEVVEEGLLDMDKIKSGQQRRGFKSGRIMKRGDRGGFKGQRYYGGRQKEDDRDYQDQKDRDRFRERDQERDREERPFRSSRRGELRRGRRGQRMRRGGRYQYADERYEDYYQDRERAYEDQHFKRGPTRYRGGREGGRDFREGGREGGKEERYNERGFARGERRGGQRISRRMRRGRGG